MKNFYDANLSVTDLAIVREMVDVVDKGYTTSATKNLPNSDIECKVYSMGDNNPTIRIDLKRVKIPHERG